jgi:ubiquinone/menaquinone biosynthesis methyltransferase
MGHDPSQTAFAPVPEAPVPELQRRAAAPAAHAEANRAMFERIAPTYDVLNRLMTAGIDRRWRTRALRILRDAAPARGARVLDLCAGTLDLAAMIEDALPDASIVACDFSAQMLARGKGKVRRTEIVVGDALALPFDDAAFDVVICGFGMRNLADLGRGIREAARVLRPGGSFVTLELFAAKKLRTRAFHETFANLALPALGAVIAGDRQAYAYLAKSMKGFVTREAYEGLLRDEGYEDVRATDLTLGVASIVHGRVRSGGAGPASPASPAGRREVS